MRKSLFLDHNSTPIQNNNKKFYSTKATILKNRTILRFYAQLCVFTHNCATFASGPDWLFICILLAFRLDVNSHFDLCAGLMCACAAKVEPPSCLSNFFLFPHAVEKVPYGGSHFLHDMWAHTEAPGHVVLSMWSLPPSWLLVTHAQKAKSILGFYAEIKHVCLYLFTSFGKDLRYKIFVLLIS